MPSLIRDSTLTLITRGVVFAVSLANSILVARLLGPSLKGSYSLAILILNVLSLLVLFGLGSANVYYGARDRSELPELTGNSLVAALVLGSVGIMLGEVALLTPVLQAYLRDNGVKIALMRQFILALPLLLLISYMQEITRASGRILLYSLISVWNVASSLFGNVIFLVILDQGIEGAIRSWVFSLALVALVAVLLALRETQGQVCINLPKLRRNFGFGVRLYPGNIAQFLNYRLDIFLVGVFLSSTEIGWYTTATVLVEKLWEVPHAIRTVLLYQVAAARDKPNVHLTTARLSRAVLLLVGVFCIVLALLGSPLIALLYGLDYLPASKPLVLLLPGVLSLSIGKLLAIHLAGIGHPEVGTWGALVSLVATLVLDLTLIPLIGVAGAAIASSVSYTLSAIVIAVHFLRFTGLKPYEILFVTRQDFHEVFQAFGNAWRRFRQQSGRVS